MNRHWHAFRCVIALLCTSWAFGAAATTSASPVLKANGYLQQTPWTCGPAALRYLLATRGVTVDEPQLASVSKTDKLRGTTLLGLKSATESLGLRAVGQRWNWSRLVEERQPVLAYVDDHHYVVVMAAGEKSVAVFDPLEGRKEVAAEDFLSSWKGVVLHISEQGAEQRAVAKSESSTRPVLTLRGAVDRALGVGRSRAMAGYRLDSARSVFAGVHSAYAPKSSLKANSMRQRAGGTADSDSGREEFLFQWSLERLAGGGLGGKFSGRVGVGLARATPLEFSASEWAVAPTVEIDYRQPLSRDGRIASQAPLEDAGSEWSDAQIRYEQEEEEIALQTANIYLDLVKSEKLLELARENASQTEIQLERARARAKSGSLAEIEVFKMEVQLSRDNSAVIESETAHKALQRRMATMLNDAGALSATLAVDFDASAKTPELSALVENAQHKRRELVRLSLRDRTIANRITAARATDDASLDVQGKLSSQRGLGSDTSAVTQWTVGLTLTVPLTDGGGASSASQAAVQLREELAAERESMLDQIHQEVSNAVSTVSAARARFDLLDKSVRLAQETLRIDQLRFERGVIAYDELQRTQYQLLQVQAEHFATRVDIKKGELELAHVSGLFSVEIL